MGVQRADSRRLLLAPLLGQTPAFLGRQILAVPGLLLESPRLHCFCRLDAPYLGVRQSWSDGAKQRVEECLNQVMVGLVAPVDAFLLRVRFLLGSVDALLDAD